MTTALMQLDIARTALIHAKSLQEIKQIIDIAKAAELYAKEAGLARENVEYATEIKIEAERKLGQTLMETPKSDGSSRGRTSKLGGKRFVPPNSPKTLKELGISKNLSSRSQKLACMNDDEFFNAKERIIKSSSLGGTNKILKEIKSQEKKDVQKKLYTEASKTYKPNTDIQIHNVDFREYAKKIEDNSIDLILTDPPYPKEFLPLWKDLAVVAERILKPGKFLIAYSGQLYLNEIFTYFKDAGLEYYWLAGLWHKGSTAIVNARNVINEMKPILIYCKPPLKKNQNTFIDMFISEKKNKDLHEWGQNIEVIELLIEKFSAPNDLIFEPFAGSGTTLTASKTLKRKCIGCETDKEMIDIIRGRVQ
uniref:Putative methyltransferase n=1 Tax=viral metagenome TaxID=1070528 RepID=A0A6M3K0V0_9ZZZZ